MKYALLSYTTTSNLGDEIQSIAARRFLPRVDCYIERDAINDSPLESTTQIILNGWFTHKPENWPVLNPLLDPLLISFHLSDSFGSSLEKLTDTKSIEFYQKHEPVGCRDYATMHLLQSKGVDAYFSGCLTLTLEKRDAPRDDTIYFVDVPQHIQRSLHLPDGQSPISITHILQEQLSVSEKFAKASALLDLYASAKMVITTRLHCALPCLAFGTPVIFLYKDKEDRRFDGLLQLLSSYSFDELRNKKLILDESACFADQTKLSEIQKGLIEKCNTFINQK